MKLSCKKIFILVVSLVLTHSAFARDHLIYSVSEEIPMGFDKEVLKKNYYVNIGNNQGIKKGTTLEVFRTISKSNPYDDKKRVNYRVKIGELEVLHSEDEAAITKLKSKEDGSKAPMFEINNFMIGDHVSVKVN